MKFANRYIINGNPLLDEIPECGFSEEMREQIHDEKLRQQTIEQDTINMQWINRSEQEPPKDRPFLGFTRDSLDTMYLMSVMVWWNGGEDQEGYNIDEGYFGLTKWGEYDREFNCDPTHWMPLPEPPNEMD